MFNNQLSSKELYSTNPSQFLQRSGFRYDQDDSAISSSQTMSQCNSQMMSSQMENSQSSSFDMFSQMMLSQQQGSSSQQTENSNIPQRFYTKYMSKAPLFTKESDRNPLSRTKRDFQEQFESNKQKAKERDDRDLINTFISLVKECTEEVKSAATGIRRDVDKNITDTASQFGSLIQKINEDLSQFHQTLLGAMKVREDHQATLDSMQQDIAARDAKIEVLEMQLESFKQQRDERVVQSLLEAYTDQQKMNRDHIDKMQEEQQTFCKMQMEHLKQEQQKYLSRRESEEEAATSTARATSVATSGRADLENGLAGLRAPAIDVDCRPHSWQGVPQGRHVGQAMGGFQQSQTQQNLMNQMHPNSITSHHKDAIVSQVIHPTGVSVSGKGGIMSLPHSSLAWSVPLDLQNRETRLQSDIGCSSGYSFNQSSIRHAIPDAQMVNNFVQGTRPSGFILPQGVQNAHAMMSPQFTSNPSGKWNANKLRPSPVATVAPQVKPKEAAHARQVDINEDRVETSEPATTAAVTKKKRGRNRNEVAVKSTRQSARQKAKQNNTSSERQKNTNQPQCKQQISRRAPKAKSTDAKATTQQTLTSSAEPQALVSVENVCKKSVSGRGRAPSKNKNQKKQSCQPQQKPSSQNQENKPPERKRRQKTSNVATNSPLKHPPQVKVVRQKPTDADVYEYTEPKEEQINRKVVRGKQGRINRQKVSTNAKLDQKPPQNEIFSQKKVSTYVKPQVGDRFGCPKTSKSHLESSKDDIKSRQQRSLKTNANYDGSSSEDEELESQNAQVDEHDQEASQIEVDGGREGAVIMEVQPVKPVGTMKVLRKTKQQSSNKKLPDKLISHPSQHQACKLDTMLPYSNEDDSSEELVFSLKLPNSPWFKTSSLQKPAEKSGHQTAGELVVPCVRSSDFLSTPHMQVLDEDSDDEESTVTAYSVCVKSGQKMSRQRERKRRLIHYAGSSSSSSAAVVEITNSLRLQHHKIRRVSSCR